MRIRYRRRLTITMAALLALPVGGFLHDRWKTPKDDPDLGHLLLQTKPPRTRGKMTLCVGGPEFWAALEPDLINARQRVLVQTLSFEADPAGLALAAALAASPARKKILIIDDFSRYVVSDKFVFDPTRLLDAELGREKASTLRLVEHLRQHGVEVVWGRPYGAGHNNRAARDHKKLVVADDASYLGGINFSEHNFLWHDLMLRVQDPAVADTLAADIRRTARGESATTRVAFDGIALVIGAGDGRPDILEGMAEQIAGATDSIYLECPYITEPYFEMLGEARRRGVAVTLVTSERINRLGMKQSIMEACKRHDLRLRLQPEGMTHVKAMLIDDRALVMGSANFDFLSASLQPEVLAVVTDPALVDDFRRRASGPALASSWEWPPEKTHAVAGPVSVEMMHLAGKVLQAIHSEDQSSIRR